jgi:HD-GYP domain-containing protein (c-di-GMP phosphodiesterase class II)
MRAQNFMAIPPGAIIPGSLPRFKIYIPSPNGGNILWAKNGNQVTPDQISRLADTGLKEVFVDLEEAVLYEEYLENHLEAILSSEFPSDEQKAVLFSKVSTNVVKNALETSFKSGKIDADTMKRTERMIKNTLQFIAESNSLQALTKMIGHDYQTYEHATKVLWFTMAFLNENPDIIEQIQPGYDALDKDQKRGILGQCGVGALLHDIGKAYVMPEIINKNGPLSDIEWEIMKCHPLHGLAMLLDTELPIFVKKAVLEHHEDFQGGGYPMMIEGTSISILARVLRIVDVFDAMTSHRPYKKALSPLNAAQIMVGTPQDENNSAVDSRDKGMKRCFDEQLLRKFIVLLGAARLSY